VAVAEIREKRGERIFVATSPVEKDQITQVPGASWDRRANGWWVPLTWAACLQLRGVFGQRLVLGDALREWAWREREDEIQPALTLREALDLDPSHEVTKVLDVIETGELRLKPFQRAAVAFLVLLEKACCFEAMGSGKTVINIRTLQVLAELGREPYPALIVCPSSLKHTVWAREIARWAPELNVIVIDGSASSRRKSLSLAAEYIGGKRHLPHCVTQTNQPRLDECVDHATPHGIEKTSAHQSGNSTNENTSIVGGKGSLPKKSIDVSDVAKNSMSSKNLASHSMTITPGSNEPATDVSSAPKPLLSSITTTPPAASEAFSASSATLQSPELTKTSNGSTVPSCTCSEVVLICNWETLRMHSRLAPYGSAHLTDAQREPKELNELPLRTIILDEAHRLCNVGQKTERQDDGSTMTLPSSQQALAAWAVTHQAHYRFALTGTPTDNHVGDLWGILHAVRPDWFPAKTRFLDRYAQTSYGLFGGMEVIGLRPDTEAEFRAVTQPMYRRIPQEVLLPQLPAFREPQLRDVALTPKQLAAYRQMEETMLAQLNELLVARGPGVQFARLMQFAAASVEVTGRDEEGHPLTRLIAPSAKVDDLVELLRELGDEPLVVGAESRQLIELAAARLEKEKVSHSLVTGSVAPVDRAHAVRRFQDGQVRVILLTFGAGAEGITLTRARYLCYLQRSWRPRFNDQFRKRVQRIGAEDHAWLQEIEIRAVGTVEERREAVLAGKEERIEEVLRDRDTLRRLLGG
jgi:hypothetical protein